MADFIQEAEQLRAELNQANYEYYVLDNPSMSCLLYTSPSPRDA